MFGFFTELHRGWSGRKIFCLVWKWFGRTEVCAEANFGSGVFEKLCDSDGAWRRVKYYCWLEVSDVARIGRSGEASSCAG